MARRGRRHLRHRVSCMANPVVINGDGAQTRDYVHVHDVVRANLAAVDGPAGVYNIGTGVETDVNTLYRMLAAASACQYGTPSTVPRKPGEQRRSCLDASAAREHLGWNAHRRPSRTASRSPSTIFRTALAPERRARTIRDSRLRCVRKPGRRRRAARRRDARPAPPQVAPTTLSSSTASSSAARAWSSVTSTGSRRCARVPARSRRACAAARGRAVASSPDTGLPSDCRCPGRPWRAPR